MSSVNWLHISDLHLRVGSTWEQDVVLKEMCRHVEQQRNAISVLDFILVTGDIAFSGKAEEYIIAEQFFDDLSSKSGVPKDRIFCVPGNHDIDRSQQKMAFTGARSALGDSHSVDSLLADVKELGTLLVREGSFRKFQESYFKGQNRTWTADGLAYTSKVQIGDLVLAIVGLDSAWLAEGGEADHGNLLVGEKQVINAMQSAWSGPRPPNVIIVMSHHPFHLLRQFDHLPVQTRVERDAHFFHHGHLHQAWTRLSGPSGSRCLTVGAGASYTTRHSLNAYSIVELDVVDAVQGVSTFVYNPSGGTYSLAGDKEISPMDITPTSHCSVRELAEAMQRHSSRDDQYAYYLSALVLGQKSEFPIAGSDEPMFASIEVVRSMPDSSLKDMATDLIRLGNLLKVFYGQEPLDHILSRHAAMFAGHAPTLMAECAAKPRLGERLDELDRDAQRLAGLEPKKPFQHTYDLFDELVAQGEWDLLKEQATRHINADDQSLAVQAKRMCALALASIGGSNNKLAAIGLYRELTNASSTELRDYRNLAVLLTETDNTDEAVCVLFNGIELFPHSHMVFIEIGQTIVTTTGDRGLRTRLEQVIKDNR
ncbi:hypothetical protein F4Y93_14795 [Candidatus Poribacteria bacterium]|nr:hypothetical protein [Candidatus Poribacteria bacterium]